ncbi:phosphoglycerate dehydrogenase [Desulfoscipio gibsoniae]|uniref:D-3-phosphoglycerate dehydrogenase n=1 Tax=Desulfoscipio gibsoniae DSM 7213 TaxID=767817 RepID=R4KJ29_9FIRM|nr:phosphoglycerate dehydrogenase [Desulfoscipio gibsoniae]AGK99640.1 D-3-phosphoglycerate dehydrogenase [Desulfoscipio gibsoniae DSM 7213]
MAQFKVLAMDNVSQKGLEPLYNKPDIEVVIGSKMTEDELIAVIGEYDAMIVRSATKVTPRVLENAPKLKVVGRAGVGVDNIDLEASTQHGVLVVNAPDGNTIAAAEHTMAMMLALARNIPQAVAKMKNGVWDKKAFLGVELRGKTLGVIGLGRIGSAVARRAQAMEMDIVAYDPYISEEKAESMGIKLATLEELLPVADFITVHMPKTKETYHMLDDKAFAAMKDGVRVINCARGGIVDEEALYKYMQYGKVAGAALDVFEKEPNTDSPLLEMNSFIATPHLGASTAEAQINVAVDVAEEIVEALQGKVVRNTVNIPSVKPEVMSKIKPYLKLAEKLGKFQAQLVEGRVNKMEVVYNGDLAGEDVKPITTALVKGFLDPILQESVNFINAPLLAKNRGISVVQTVNGRADGYASLITLKVISDKGEKSLSGTLFQENEPRIVMVDGYRVDAVPEGNMLYVPHMDKPRIIGPVGMLIGEHQINIAGMQVGRKEIGGKAVMMLSVDAPVPEETLKAIAEIDGVLDVKFVSL